MDLLRFEDKDVGAIYLDGRMVFCLCGTPNAPDNTKLVAYNGPVAVSQLDIAADVDELAQAIERAVPGARIHRITV